LGKSIRRWTEVSSDPNSIAAISLRESTVHSAHKPPVKDKIEYIVELVRGRRVLDVGVVAHFVEAERDKSWLHHHVASAASYCVGVDILPGPVQQLRERGYNVIVRDITKEPLDEQFDVIVCGDVIEHLPNPQGLFDAATRMLSPGGRLLIATPNPFYLHRAYRFMRGRYRDSVDHVMHFDASNIAEMAERAGMLLDSFRGVMLDSRSFRSCRSKVKAQFLGLWPILGFSRDSLCNTMLYECVKG